MGQEEKDAIYEQIIALMDEKNTKALGAFLDLQRSSDIAEAVELLDSQQKRSVFDAMDDKELAAEVLEKVDEATRAELFEEVLENEEIASLVSELPPDEAADLLSEMDEEESQEVLASLDDEDARQIQGLMQYEGDSAGGIMQPMILAVEENLTVQQTIDMIRKAEGEEEFYCVFVVNSQRVFLGTVGIRHLLSSTPQTPLRKIIDPNSLFVSVDTDQEDICNLFKKNNLLIAPVLDDQHRLVGGITADRVLEVAEEEAAEDIYTLAGTDAEELESFSAFHAARIRMTWLLPCLIGAAITAFIGLFFKKIFTEWNQLYIFITAFLFTPMIGAISGNAGLQTSAIVICGLATGDLAALRIKQVFYREIRIALLIAICCGIIGGLVCAFLPQLLPVHPSFAPSLQGTGDAGPIESQVIFHKQIKLALAFGFAMFSAILLSTSLGLLLPFLFRKIGIDPAISSGPLVTTANDSISILVYMLLVVVAAQ